MVLLNGLEAAESIHRSLIDRIKEIKKQKIRDPALAIILIGDNSASHLYVNAKIKICNKIGIIPHLLFYDHISESVLMQKIHSLNDNPTIDGIIVQLPVTTNINTNKIFETISPLKDVDGFSFTNYGKMARGITSHMPATPLGIIKLIDYYRIETQGKHCVIIGRGPTVGAPLSIMMSQNQQHANCTVTLCHSKTHNIEFHTKHADIIVAAIGKPWFLNKNMVKSGVVVIDVGINRIADNTKKSGYRLLGDVNFIEVAEQASYITPVPGGVGPMTISALLSNTIDAYQYNSL